MVYSGFMPHSSKDLNVVLKLHSIQKSDMLGMATSWSLTFAEEDLEFRELIHETATKCKAYIEQDSTLPFGGIAMLISFQNVHAHMDFVQSLLSIATLTDSFAGSELSSDVIIDEILDLDLENSRRI